MAKDPSYHPGLLFLFAALLMTVGWLMSPFPVFIFFALAPLFAITDRIDTHAVVWEKMEWVLLSLTVLFLAARLFDFAFIVSSMAYAILFTLTFTAFAWCRQVLGDRVVKITIVLLWLAIEYLLLKLYPIDSVYLADALRLQPDWVRWNIHTGYLGTSGWILVTNLAVYQAFLSRKHFQWPWLVTAVLLLVVPVIYSYSLDSTSLTRGDMVNFYTDKSIMKDVTYISRGEWIVRTAAWVSILILLYTFVKSQTTKR